MRNNTRPASTDAAPRTGTHSIEKAVLLLREIASRGRIGWGLRDLAQHCGMGPGTVHRILRCLVEERLVKQRETDRRYVIGPLNLELGLSVPNAPELIDTAHAVLRRLALVMPKVNSVCFLRSGDDCVCFAREGHTGYTSQATMTRTGHRQPLLAFASGVAIVAALPPAAARKVYERNRQRLAHLDEAHFARLERLLKSCRRDGYVLSEGDLWHGVNSIAVAFGPLHDPVGGVAVSAWSGNHPASALKQALPNLRVAAEALAKQAAAS